ncbi:hypothetical protein ACFL35_13675 [Candidatus Riflebacteria bacterium]
MPKTKFNWILLFIANLFWVGTINAGAFEEPLQKARKIMQSAFQMNFLSSMPVIFHRDSFNRMFAHTEKSIDNMQMNMGRDKVTRKDLMDDKSLHIKKSAELALHIKSVIGSAHLAYGATMAIGLVKEAIDGSFLNPKGHREAADLYADHVGAQAVFGEDRFDKGLNKYLPHFLKKKSGGEDWSLKSAKPDWWRFAGNGAGVALGATLGSLIIPPLGTIVGGVTGGILGGKVYDFVKNIFAKKSVTPSEATENEDDISKDIIYLDEISNTEIPLNYKSDSTEESSK